jgi:hypothetical protein
MKHMNDIDGNILRIGDSVVVLDTSELEGDAPIRGMLLQVAGGDTESNYIDFGSYVFYGHRVLKVKGTLYATDYVIFDGTDAVRFSNGDIIVYSDMMEAVRDSEGVVGWGVIPCTSLPVHLQEELRRQVAQN